MSTLWTPSGERPIRREPEPEAPGAPQVGGEPSEEELRAQWDEIQEQLAQAPAAVVIANHAFGLSELAALHLTRPDPRLGDARLAIDAFAALVEQLGDRLGEHEPALRERLAQLRLAFVQVHAGAPGHPRAEGPGPSS